jgi:hypothetical protein
MTDPARRIEDMDRVGIDLEVLSPLDANVYFAPRELQAEVARLVDDAYADLAARYPQAVQRIRVDPDGRPGRRTARARAHAGRASDEASSSPLEHQPTRAHDPRY